MTAPLMISGVFSRLGTFVSSLLIARFSTLFFSSESETRSSFWATVSLVALQLGLLFDITLCFLFGVFARGFNEASLDDFVGCKKSYGA